MHGLEAKETEQTATHTRVVVPSLGAGEALDALLASLKTQDKCRIFEVVVVLDGTETADAEAAAQRHPWVTFSWQEHRGAAAARNRGASGFEGELLLFVDSDMVCESGFVGAHQRAHSSARRAVVVGPFPTTTVRASFMSEVVEEWTSGWVEAAVACGSFDAVCSGNVSFPKGLFDDLIGFDQKFSEWGREDSEIGLRALDLEATIVFEPSAVARQTYSKSPSEFCSDFRSLGREDIELATSHPEVLGKLLVAHLHRAPWPSVALRKLALQGLTEDALRMTLAILDAAHSRGHTGSELIDLTWSSADMAYWQGVADTKSELALQSAQSAAILTFHDLSNCPGLESSLIPVLRHLVSEGHKASSVMELLMLRGQNMSWPAGRYCLTFDDGLASHLSIARELAIAGIPATFFVPTGLLGTEGHLRLPDVAEILALGLDVQMHGHLHKPLTGLTAQEVAAEVKLSREILSSVGAKPSAIALPFGANSRNLRRMLADIDVSYAFSTVSARADRLGDPRDISRITVPDGSNSGDLRSLIECGMRADFALGETQASWARVRPAANWEQAGLRDPTRIFQFQFSRQG
jgi:GT2 family glycosyltransferase